jgi:hypothetical protein
MSEENTADKKFVLIEGPRWGDAEFYGNWLLAAAKANRLVQQAEARDPEFRKAREIIEILYRSL